MKYVLVVFFSLGSAQAKPITVAHWGYIQSKDPYVKNVELNLRSPDIARTDYFFDNTVAQNPTAHLATLKKYDAILVWSHYVTPQLTQLLTQLKDAGVGLVLAGYTLARYAAKWMPISCSDFGSYAPGFLRLGRKPIPQHPLLTSVTRFRGNAAISSYRCNSARLNPRTKVAAFYDNGQPLVAYRGDLKARLVSLNFLPFSTTVNSYSWLAGDDGGKLMVNALKFVAGGSNQVVSPPKKTPQNGPKPVFDTEF